MGLKVAHVLMGLIFLAGTWVQFNDPDPLWWVVIYGAAALACAVAVAAPRLWQFPAAVATGALVWVLILAPQALPTFRVRDLVKTMETSTPAIELSRELLGLLIILAWMVVCTVLARRRRSTES